MEKYLLLKSDGYSVEYSQFDTIKQAKAAMVLEYNDLMPSDNDESSAEMSEIGETSAILYANGENVYVWNIATCHTGTTLCFSGLPKALEEFKESNGKYGACKDWSINLGLDDIWWILYYKNNPIIRCKKGMLIEETFAETFDSDEIEILFKYVKQAIKM